MNRKLVAFTAIILTAFFFLHKVETNRADTAAEEELIKLDKEWNDANTHHDAAFYEKFIAEDYLRLGGRGEVFKKDDEVNFIKSDTRQGMSLIGDDYVVHVYEESAVMTHRYLLKVGDDVRVGHSMHTFVKRQGSWQVVATATSEAR